MDSEIKKVLITIVDSADKNKSGKVRESQVAHITGIKASRLKIHLKVLLDARHIQIIQGEKGERLILTTLAGIEKAIEWKKEINQKPLQTFMAKIGRWLLGAMATALFALLLWYFGLTPDTLGIQPLSSQIPIKVYDVGTYPPSEPSQLNWYAFALAEAPSNVAGRVINWEDKNGLEPILGKYSPSTLTGNVVFQLAVENIANKYQVDISSIDVLVKEEGIKDVEDLYFIPVFGLGGGGYWEYEVSVAPDKGSPLSDGSRIYPAAIIYKGEEVDYIYVEPGKRETFEINVTLATPGRYTLTPLFTYSFRGKTKKLLAEPYSVVYPEKYRIWVDDPSLYGTSDGRLVTSNLIVDNAGGLIQQETPSVFNNNKCLPQNKWIFFTSTMAISGVLHQFFVIDTNGENMRLLDGDYFDPRHELFIAWTNSGMVRLRLEDWVNQQKSYTYELFDPNNGARLDWTNDVENLLIPGSEVSSSYFPSYTSPDGLQVAFIKKLDANPNVCDPNGGEQIFISNADGSQERQVTQITGLYQSLSWSPNGQFIAYAASRLGDNVGDLCSGDIRYNIYVMDLLSGIEYQLTDNSLGDNQPTWSYDSQWIVSGGERLVINKWDGSCTQTILVPNFGEIWNISLQP